MHAVRGELLAHGSAAQLGLRRRGVCGPGPALSTGWAPQGARAHGPLPPSSELGRACTCDRSRAGQAAAVHSRRACMIPARVCCKPCPPGVKCSTPPACVDFQHAQLVCCGLELGARMHSASHFVFGCRLSSDSFAAWSGRVAGALPRLSLSLSGNRRLLICCSLRGGRG